MFELLDNLIFADKLSFNFTIFRLKFEYLIIFSLQFSFKLDYSVDIDFVITYSFYDSIMLLLVVFLKLFKPCFDKLCKSWDVLEEAFWYLLLDLGT